MNPRRISPTAHYTSWVWFKNGLSPASLATLTGRLLFRASAPFNRLSERLLGGLTLERMLLQRHHVIDHLLDQAIAAGARQVVELGCGLSGRGLRTLKRHPDLDLRYVEGDLSAMVRDKAAKLRRAGLLRESHRIIPIDVLATGGSESIEVVAERELDPARFTVVITEGLVDYFDAATVGAMWQRWAALLARGAGGVYLSDLHLISEAPRSLLVGLFVQALERGTGGRLVDSFDDAASAERALRTAGFSSATLHRPSAFYHLPAVPRLHRAPITRVIEARVGP